MGISRAVKFAPISVLVALLAAGCSSLDVVTYDTSSRRAKDVDQVEVLLEKPTRGYRVIARIQFGPDAFVSDYQAQTAKVVDRAAAIGVDAVIVSYESRVSGYIGGNATGGVYGATSESNVTVGLAIVYE